MRPQNYANHTHRSVAYHMIAAPLGLAYLIWAIVRALRTPGNDAYFDLLGAFAIAAAIAVSRLQALRVQDRLIRHEERTRLATVLPPDLVPRIGELRTSQLIALRFADESEVEEHVRAVLAAPTMTSKAIKQRIRRWKADWFRA